MPALVSKSKKRYKKKSYRLISLMNVDAEIIKKYEQIKSGQM